MAPGLEKSILFVKFFLVLEYTRAKKRGAEAPRLNQESLSEASLN